MFIGEFLDDMDGPSLSAPEKFDGSLPINQRTGGNAQEKGTRRESTGIKQRPGDPIGLPVRFLGSSDWRVLARIH
jgi:hypothetical protein